MTAKRTLGDLGMSDWDPFNLLALTNLLSRQCLTQGNREKERPVKVSFPFLWYWLLICVLWGTNGMVQMAHPIHTIFLCPSAVHSYCRKQLVSGFPAIITAILSLQHLSQSRQHLSSGSWLGSHALVPRCAFGQRIICTSHLMHAPTNWHVSPVLWCSSESFFPSWSCMSLAFGFISSFISTGSF